MVLGYTPKTFSSLVSMPETAQPIQVPGQNMEMPGTPMSKLGPIYTEESNYKRP